MKNTLLFFPLIILALSSCATSTEKASPKAVKSGMTKEQIKSTLGTPGYKYTVNEQETWIYTLANPVTGQVKSTALNLVPVAGPVISYLANRTPNTEPAKQAITFDKDDKVIRIEEAKEATPAKAEKTSTKG